MASAARRPPPQLGEARSDIEQRRKMMDDFTVASFNSVAESGPPMVEEFTHRVPVADGVIRVRTYRPVHGGELGCYVYIHGGGWWLGNIDIYDGSCRAMADHLGCVVASVGYRLAPEHVFPTHPRLYAALLWVSRMRCSGSRRASIRLVAQRRGNIAQAWRSGARSGGRRCEPVLDLPATDLTCSAGHPRQRGWLPAHEEGMEDAGVSTRTIRPWMNPYASPMQRRTIRIADQPVSDLRTRPAADEGEQYAMKLVARRSAVTRQRALGHIPLATHGEADARRRPLQPTPSSASSANNLALTKFLRFCCVDIYIRWVEHQQTG